MKKNYIHAIIFSLFLYEGKIFSQNLGINTDGSSPETGVMLDIKSPTAKATTAAVNTLFQIKSFDPNTDALKLRLGFKTDAAQANRYGFIDFPDFTASTPTYLNLSLQPSGGNVGIGLTNPDRPLVVSGPWSGDVVRIESSIASQGGLWVKSGAQTGRLESFPGSPSTVSLDAAGGTDNDIDFRTNSTTRMTILGATGNVGIGTSSPTSKLSVGASSEFQVNSTGNIIKINNVTYSFPSAQGAASSLLQNDGAGNLSWGAGGSGSVTSVSATPPLSVTNPTTTPNILLSGTAGGIYYGTGGGSAFSVAGAAGQALISGGAGVPTWTTIHAQSHAITSTSDHTAGNWKVFYSNGSGQVTELALPAAGQVLTSNGVAAAPIWSTNPSSLSGFYANQSVFTANGTWVNPGNVTKVMVEVWGGGGGGGSTAVNASGGGGAGGYGRQIYTITTATNIAITVGGGGAVAGNGGTSSAIGGAVSVTATGGSGCAGGAGAAGGTGGTCAATFNITGGQGAGGSNSPTRAGDGGNPGGDGGSGGGGAGYGAGAAAATAGTSPGGGGGGGTAGAAAAGGGAGRVVVWY